MFGIVAPDIAARQVLCSPVFGDLALQHNYYLGILPPTLMDRTVKTLLSRDKLEKVEIYQRPSGTFGFEHYRWDAEDSTWIPFGKYSLAIVDTADRAESEARARIAWLVSDGAADA